MLTVESKNSIGSHPSGVSVLNRCDKIKFIGTNVNFQVYDYRDNTYVMANVEDPPTLPLTITSIERHDDGRVTIEGSTQAGSTILINGAPLAHSVDPDGRFTFTFTPDGRINSIQSVRGNSVSSAYYISSHEEGLLTPKAHYLLSRGFDDNMFSVLVHVNRSPSMEYEYTLDGGRTWEEVHFHLPTRFYLPVGIFTDGSVMVRAKSGDMVSSTVSLGPMLSPLQVVDVRIDLNEDSTYTVTGLGLPIMGVELIEGIVNSEVIRSVQTDEYGLFTITLAANRINQGSNHYLRPTITTTDGRTLTGYDAITFPPLITAEYGTYNGRVYVITQDLIDQFFEYQVSVNSGIGWETVIGDRFPIPPGSYPEGAIQVQAVRRTNICCTNHTNNSNVVRLEAIEV